MSELTDYSGTHISNVCSVCLKSEPDIKLRPASSNEIKQLSAVLQTVLFNEYDIKVCMLCGHLLTKFYKFSYQCCRASLTLTKYCTQKSDIENLSIYNLVTTDVKIVCSINEECDVKSEDIILDNTSLIGDDSVDDELPLSMLNKNDDEDLQIITLDAAVKEENLDNIKENISDSTERKRNRKKKKGKRKVGEKKEKLRKGFSSRMVQETDEYLVIKLIADEVLKEMADRAKSESYLRAPYKCSLCVKGFNFEDVLQKHMEKHSRKHGTYQCSMCHQYCPSTVSLRGHIKSHTTRYKCKICGEVRLSRQHLLEHFTNSHTQESVTYTCEHCQFVTNKRTVIQRHVKSHKPSLSHACEHCGQRFKSIETLRVHNKRHDTSSLLSCPQCNKRFLYQSMLQKHVESVHVNQEYYCVECDKRFNSPDNLKIHFKKAKRHRDPSAYLHKCSECGERFKTASLFCEHLTSKHGHEKLACQICNRQYSTKDSLRCHIRRHHSVKKPPSHACQFCDKVFTQKCILSRHARVHTGERPYACGECSLRFAQSSTRDTHVALVHRRRPGGKKRRVSYVDNMPQQIAMEN